MGVGGLRPLKRLFFVLFRPASELCLLLFFCDMTFYGLHTKTTHTQTHTQAHTHTGAHSIQIF